MNRLQRVALVAVAFLVIAGAAACGRHAIFPETEEHIVGTGDTVYSIAWSQEVDYRDLARWNRLKPPYRIFPGQRLVLHPFGGYPEEPQVAKAKPQPAPGRQVETRPMGASKPLETRPVTPSKPPMGTVESGAEAEPAQRLPAPASAPSVVAFAGPWGWPTQGKAGPTQSAGGRKGIDIPGAQGQAIRAARGGRVVYAGSGLKGYGLLTIVKHDESYLSAYGHNDRLLVREGDEVVGGQQIAAMGIGPQNQPLLYFEVRRDGKPINPYEVLPKK
ncbi:MAG: peptidoglycan DD-metalloendopeptidase family protein [Nevskiales bacterium]